MVCVLSFFYKMARDAMLVKKIAQTRYMCLGYVLLAWRGLVLGMPTLYETVA